MQFDNTPGYLLSCCGLSRPFRPFNQIGVFVAFQSVYLRRQFLSLGCRNRFLVCLTRIVMEPVLKLSLEMEALPCEYQNLLAVAVYMQLAAAKISCCIYHGISYTSVRFHKGMDRCVQPLVYPSRSQQGASYPGAAGGLAFRISQRLRGRSIP